MSPASRSPRVGSRAFMIFAVIHLARVELGCSSLGSTIPLHGHRATHHDPGVTAPNPHAARAMAHRPAPLQAGARSTGRGLRVGEVVSLGWGFVGTLEPWVAYAAAVPKREVLCCKSADG